MKRLLLISALAAIVLSGCVPKGATRLGENFGGAILPVVQAKQTNEGARVVVRGTMTEKCPVAGCWFALRDATGFVKVDTKNAGFVVVDVPLQALLTVCGRVVTEGTERKIEAIGVLY